MDSCFYSRCRGKLKVRCEGKLRNGTATVVRQRDALVGLLNCFLPAVRCDWEVSSPFALSCSLLFCAARPRQVCWNQPCLTMSRWQLLPHPPLLCPGRYRRLRL